MGLKGKKIGWAVAFAAVAAVITAGSVYASSASPAPVTVHTSEQRKAVLVPLAEQEANRFAFGPMTFTQAAAEGALQPPAGMEFKPASCANYLEAVLGPLDRVDGWIQYGSRNHTDHNDNFLQAVVAVPGGGTNQAFIDRVRSAIRTCVNGTLTLQGKATGKVTYTDRAPLNLPGAAAYGTTLFTGFNETPGTEGYNAVVNYAVPPNSAFYEEDQVCVAEINFAVQGDTLIVVVESDLAYADQLTTQMHQRLQTV